MAVGVEKLKDSGYSGLVRSSPPSDGTAPSCQLTAPAAFSLLDPAYCKKYGVDPDAMREAMTHVAWKNHANGAKNPRAQFRKEIPKEKIAAGAGAVAGRLGVLDCSGVSDGSACALIVRAEDALRVHRPADVREGIGDGRRTRERHDRSVIRLHDVPGGRPLRAGRLPAGGRDDPREQISLAEVHDCFTPTELVLMEDMGFSDRGQAWRDELDGVFDLDGELPVNPDGGLKSLRPPGRGERSADALRVLAAVPRRGRRPPNRRPQARADA